jgi:hypothetical protein
MGGKLQEGKDQGRNLSKFEPYEDKICQVGHGGKP